MSNGKRYIVFGDESLEVTTPSQMAEVRAFVQKHQDPGLITYRVWAGDPENEQNSVDTGTKMFIDSADVESAS